ncbi:hypothetical protein AAC387_Pa05g1632 [Persea americana]
MDIWVAAAAAGAGYLAKYWKNVKESRRLPGSSLESSDNNKSTCTSSLAKNLDQKRVKLGRVDSIDKNSTFRWVRRKSEKQTSSNVEEDETFLDPPTSDVLGSPTNERVSTSGVVSAMPSNLVEQEEDHALSLSNLRPSFSGNENHEEDGNRIGGIDDFSNKSGCAVNDQANSLQVGVGYRFGRGRSSLNSKRSHGYSYKPLNSLESCTIAQLCKEYVETEECDFNSLPSSSSTPSVRPFSVSDNQLTRNSESSEDPLVLQCENGEHKLQTEGRVDLSAKENLIGFLPPFKVGLVEIQKKSRRRRVKLRQQISHMSDTESSGEHFYSQGSPDGVLLFCLGISIGSISTLQSNRSEVEKLNELLSHTQNLVQDLREELEMKDSLTVKELAYEDCRFQELIESSAGIKESIDLQPYQGSTTISPVQGALMISECAHDKPHIQKEGENSESMSEIEAELEAELSRLDLNIKTSDPGRSLSDFDELDPDFVSNIVHGELKANMVKGAADSDQDACGSSTTHVCPTNYAVSPRELSLRLHELIESRLEERIAELESAVEDSQKRLHLMEAGQVCSQRGFSSSEMGSLSTHESPTVMEYTNTMSPPPLFLNLSDNALNSYDEAYAELVKISNTKNENTSEQTNNKGAFPLDPIPYGGWAGNGDNGSLLHLEIDKNKSNGIGESDDNDDDEEELGRLLIKRIVEKTRQGSPLVLNAQRILFSMDE